MNSIAHYHVWQAADSLVNCRQSGRQARLAVAWERFFIDSNTHISQGPELTWFAIIVELFTPFDLNFLIESTKS